MIVRIVRMTIVPGMADEFVEIFTRTKDAIRNVEGCSHLELLRDADHENVFTTLSHWHSVNDLDNYRNSDLFKNVWVRVKPLFARTAEAFSLEKFIEV
ncbi:MAG TPA: antibiotic biosynthesis monooxygenase family protein [Cyclobacteriaceae bacterium]|nr:antibiotic biosynthesis monooxygenase family protein [Cyclobacteriaceae bacterium]